MRPTPSAPGVGRRSRRCIVWMEGVRRPWMPPPPPRCPIRVTAGTHPTAPERNSDCWVPRGGRRRCGPGLRRAQTARPARVPAAPRGRGGHDRAPRRRHLGRRAAAHGDGHRLRLRPQAPIGARGDLCDVEHAIVWVRPRHSGRLARCCAVRAFGRSRAAGAPCRRRRGCPPAARLGARPLARPRPRRPRWRGVHPRRADAPRVAAPHDDPRPDRC